MTYLIWFGLTYLIYDSMTYLIYDNPSMTYLIYDNDQVPDDLPELGPDLVATLSGL